jgi:hypothetical protein
VTNRGDYRRPPIAAIAVVVAVCGAVAAWPLIRHWALGARQRYLDSRMFVTTVLALDPDEPHDAVEIAREALYASELAELLLVPDATQPDAANFLSERFDVVFHPPARHEDVTVRVTYLGDGAEAVMFGAPVTEWTGRTMTTRP